MHREGSCSKAAGVLSKVQMLNLVLGVGVFSLLPTKELLFGQLMRRATLLFSESGGSLNGPNLFTELPFLLRNAYQTPHSLNASLLFTENPFFFTEKCFIASPFKKQLQRVSKRGGRTKSALKCLIEGVGKLCFDQY